MPNFQSEFTSFDTFERKSAFDSFNTNFKTEFQTNTGRLKKEIKPNDRLSSKLSKSEETYFHHGHHDSSAHASEGHDTHNTHDIYPKSDVLSAEHKKDIVQLYIPDPLAPGHPMGNGNHGWAPIEEWAKVNINKDLNTPDWANSEIFPNHKTIQDWSGKVNTKIKTWSSPAPVIIKTTQSFSQHPTQRSFNVASKTSYKSPLPAIHKSPEPQIVSKSTPRPRNSPSYSPSPIPNYSPSPNPSYSPSPSPSYSPSPSPTYSPSPSPSYNPSPSPSLYSRSSTGAPIEVSTMRSISPVTPMYHTNFGDYASLDVHHHSGPTGPPGLPLFKTVSPEVFLGGQPHSNSHYMEQNPFLVSPVTAAPVSITAATAAAVKRKIVDDLYNYNPVSDSPVVKTYDPYERSVKNKCKVFIHV